MTTTLEFPIELCPDCTMWFANADDSGVSDPERFHAALDAAAAENDRHFPNGWRIVVLCDGDDFFSKSPCDMCRCEDGMRNNALFIEEEKK